MVTTATIDLGPATRSYAEQYGSRYLERPLHIGTLSFRLWTGRFMLEDVVIEGLTAQSEPWLRARQIEVTMPWSTLLDKRVVLDSIEMTDWRVYLEVLENGKHNLPKLTPRGTSNRESGWTTTLRWVRAHRGEFTYQDHGTPWSIVTRNLDVTVARPGSEYRGEARFSNGTVAIQDYLPFSAQMTSSFKIDGSRVVFDRIALETDGAQSIINGDVNLKYFPEMMYRVESTIDFGRMREIFFARERFQLAGTGRFSGHFHLFKDMRPDGRNSTGRELFGTFDAPRVTLNSYQFSSLRGSVKWTPRRLAVTDAVAGVYGGNARFGYEMSPLGIRGVPAIARFDARLGDVSLRQITDLLELDGMRLSGGVSGDVNLTWPLGRFSAERRMKGALRVEPPPGVTLMTERVPVELIDAGKFPPGPTEAPGPLVPTPIGGDLTFDIGPQLVQFAPSTVATERTFVRFEGSTTAGGENATLPFAASSADWQESYRVFAAVRTALGSPTTAIEIGGHGTVTGVATGDLRRPRIEATFAGERMHVWDVDWGSARGRAVLENGYADVAETTVTSGPSTIRADGRFALGVPRQDGGDEMNATVRLVDRPIADLAQAFSLERVPLSGLLSGDFHIRGAYRRPFGDGTLEIAEGTAWGEPFETATAKIDLEGTGVRLTAIEMTKGMGRGSGSASVNWDGAYSFDFASVIPIPVESIARLSDSMPPELPLSGLIDFRANGAGTFDDPQFEVTGAVRDLFVADEGVGEVAIKSLVMKGDMLAVDAVVSSSRLSVDVTGQVALNDRMDGQIRFKVNETSLDPYLRAFDPRLSPYTTAIVSGTIDVKGPLAQANALDIDAHVTSIDMRLFDYRLRNAGAFDIEFGDNVVRIPRSRPLALYGDDTKLEISGEIGLDDETLAMEIQGDANLALLQGFASNLRSSGNATLLATLSGAIRNPVVKGTLQVQNGRIRHFAAPLALERITGTIDFTERGISLDGLTAEVGEGQVKGRLRFEGNIEKQGYLPGQINVTVASIGERAVGIHYPEGLRSEVEIERLTLRGTLDDMRLDGEVRIRSAVYSRPFENPLEGLTDFFDRRQPEPPSAPKEGLSLPLRYDGILIRAQSSIRVDNTGQFSARLASSANLELRGTFDQPVLFGEMELDRGGEFTVFGKRYQVTQGTVYFNNPTKIEPSYDVEAETRVRVPGETYLITMNIRGTGRELAGLPAFVSDPPLSDPEIYALLINDVPPAPDRELRRARTGLDADEQVLEAAVGQLIASRVSGPLERTFGVDFLLTPTLLNPDLQSSRSEPGVRVLIGRRVSRQLYLTYLRNLSTSTNDEIIVLEYDATDRVTWILSRNEDQTYAIEVRMRRTF
jgi:hypothetical protein